MIYIIIYLYKVSLHVWTANVTGVSKVSFETFENDKQKYTKIKDYKLSIRPEHCEMHFTNLFNGDKRLGM